MAIKLYYYCKKCNKENILPFTSSNRVDLSRKVGIELKLNCKKCNNHNLIRINEVKAKESRAIKIISLSIMISSIVLGGIIIKSYWRTDLAENLDVLVALMMGIALFFIPYFSIKSFVSQSIRQFNNSYV